LSKAEAPAPITSSRLPASPAKSICWAVCSTFPAGSLSKGLGVIQAPEPSMPVASTSRRARSTTSPSGVTKRSRSRSASGSIASNAWSWRTGRSSTWLYQSR
jgi:hypothetical protein